MPAHREISAADGRCCGCSWWVPMERMVLEGLMSWMRSHDKGLCILLLAWTRATVFLHAGTHSLVYARAASTIALHVPMLSNHAADDGV